MPGVHAVDIPSYQAKPNDVISLTQRAQKMQVVKDALAYTELLDDPEADVPLLRVLNSPPRGIGQATAMLARLCFAAIFRVSVDFSATSSAPALMTWWRLLA